jgi:hypothetical protein
MSKITIVTIVYNRLQLLELIRGYDYGEFDGMKIGRGNRSTRGKPAPAPLCPSLDQTAVGLGRKNKCIFQENSTLLV